MYFQFQSSVTHQSASVQPIAVAVKPATLDPTNPTDVAENCTIKSVEIHVRLLNSSTSAIQQQIIVLYKRESGGVSLAVPGDYLLLNAFTMKRNILHVDQANIGATNSMMEWHIRIKIPPHLRVFRNGDQLQLCIFNGDVAQDTLSYCGFATYKWYT